MPCDPFIIYLTSNANRDINVCSWWRIYNWKLSINCLVYCIIVYFNCMKSWLLIASREISKYIFIYADMIFGFLWHARGRRDRMVVGLTTTYAISAYHHWCCQFESRSGRGVQQYAIKFVSDLRQVGGFLRVFQFLPPIKLTATI